MTLSLSPRARLSTSTITSIAADSDSLLLYLADAGPPSSKHVPMTSAQEPPPSSVLLEQAQALALFSLRRMSHFPTPSPAGRPT